MVRGTAIGAAFGILPGGGPTIAAFSAYTLEKKVSRTPERFGKGAIEGVAAPEAANNAAAQACFIPMLSLGIPPNALMALMIGAMMIHGIQPGPEHHHQAAGAVLGPDRQHVDRQRDAGDPQPAADRHLGAAAAGAVRLSVSLHPGVLLHRHLRAQQQHRRRPDHDGVRRSSATSSASSTASRRRSCSAWFWGRCWRRTSAAPCVLSDGDWSVFVRRPISLGFLLLAAALLLATALPNVRRKREEAFRD